jgi:leucyl aminopeptidase
MELEVTQASASEVEADLVAVGLFSGEELPTELAETAGAGDAKGGFKKTALLHSDGRRVLIVGLGERSDFDAERARVAAAIAAKRGQGFEATSLALGVPDQGQAAAIAAALVEGAVLSGYRFDRYRSGNGNGEDEPKTELERLTLCGPAEIEAEAAAALVGARAQNRARELQDLPSNVATPSFLAARADEIAGEHASIEVDVIGRDELIERGMGGLEAVSAGSDEEPKLIVLRYSGDGRGPVLGLVGKAVTFDTGGISIKPAASMHEMKMDMSGGAAVLEATAAIAELELPVELIAVVPSTENMPSGHAVKPGDIITQYNGKTVEVNNTDAEGRLILADALAYCAELGAERIVDLATLTGAVLVALGSTYAALISNDDQLAADVAEAGELTGELAWRLPLHPEYKELTKGTVADLTNASAKRKAGTIYAGSFLEEFVDGKPWAHLDIAGTAWDTGREYWGAGASGFGVRLLVALARDLASE